MGFFFIEEDEQHFEGLLQGADQKFGLGLFLCQEDLCFCSIGFSFKK